MELRRVVKFKDGRIIKSNWFDCDKLRVAA